MRRERKYLRCGGGGYSGFTLKDNDTVGKIATLCSSPPDNVFTSWSMIGSKFIGLSTSVLNCGCMNAALICFNSNILTVLANFGLIVCGFKLTARLCLASSPASGTSPARRRTKVVLPVPFSPNMTMISESVKEPASTVSLKPPRVLWRVLSMRISSAVSTILKERDSSRKRRFSVGMNPSRKMLIPDTPGKCGD
ncbi:uncharacterized protein STEHIDRAFT_129667 [Stereum hirsutum FP-91666 SS1]|uniref:uncharacterized protein n=1 Tax=Stereum hirsutum (strain FP-91666) TaxID=721885 RepID=UPI000440F9CD|nr:uncharacterized protein STEHIDRAFT_129667 [Stereum hirsutum FP-91666 SS1]EIM89140.1 hypothetical protein STEHIDRAFT_129667 [Stereum hirsutum FP-91666 SS1]